MLVNVILFVLGLACLIAGAEFLVRGASRLAVAAGISPLVIGLTVVALGTSTPEAAVTIDAAMAGQTDLALGNVVGSNIFNILLILGISAIVAPLAVNSQLIRQEVPIMIGVFLLLIALAYDGAVSRWEAGLLFSLLIVYTGFLVWQAKSGTATNADSPDVAELTTPGKFPAPVLVIAGFALLVLGGHWLVGSATEFARAFGVSELVIGLTVVAVGTSMPEAATAVAAVMRGETDMAIGNAVGSNLMNVLACLGLAGMVSPTGLPAAPALLNFDLWVMLGASVLCLPIIITGRRISRGEGCLLLGYCIAYLVYTLLAATHHDALPAFSNAMLWVVIPITVLTLLGSLLIPGNTNAKR
jgi:cation:H+ antiporter